MSKIIKQLLSILLVLTLVINLLPLNVLALETSDVSKMAASTEAVGTSDASTSIEASSLDKQTLPAEIVGEDLSRRSEYGKEFLLNNGLRLAAVYPTPVHYKEDGKWEEIDNTLTATNVNGQSVYSSGKGLWRVDFPQQLSGSDAISITKDGYTVSFGMAGEMRSNGDLVVASVGVDTEVSSTDALTIGSTKISTAQPQTIDTTSAKATAEFEETVLEKLFSRLIYPSVYDNTNVIYDLSGNQLKESVIIQQHDADLWGYRYALDTGGLVPVLNDDRSVDLLDPITSAIVMSMPAPFMLDANAEYCDEVEVSLVQKGDAYVLSYYLPREWMADESRAWPVVLDPIVEAGTSPNNILDHYVAENYSASNSSGALMSGYHASYGKMRTFIKFSNIPALSSADVLVEATLTLSYLSGGTTGETAIGAHKVNANWTTGSITWANQPAHNSTVEDCTYVGNSGKYSWNITDIARGWYEAENTGVMLKALASIESGTTSNWKKFYSVDYSIYSTNLWPSLTIQYRDAAGIEDYWDYTSSGAGRAGTGYVQNYTGNLVWVHNDMGFDGNRMPVSISHIYNAHDAWDSENSTGNNPFGMGNGWRTNFNQIIYSTTDGAYVWEDGDGTRHYFTNTSTTGSYKDTDGLGLTLSVSSTGYTLTDKYDNKSVFDTKGRLTSQVNNQATTSSIKISYQNTSSNLISTILDGVDRKYSFVYDSSLLKTINYYGTGSTIVSSINFGYTNSNLTSITYADKAVSTFTYTSKNLLSSATDIDGYKISYNYSTLTSGKPSRIISIAESYKGIAGSSTTFAYTHKQTVLTDHNSKTHTLFFNEWGNTTSIQDNEGLTTFYQYATDRSSAETKNQLVNSSLQQNTVVNILKDSGFEKETVWNAPSSTVEVSVSDDANYIGSKSLKLVCAHAPGSSGASWGPYTVSSGDSVTFSAYLYSNGLVSIRIKDDLGNYVDSDHLDGGNIWTRREVTYTNTTSATRTLILDFFLMAACTVYADCLQLEEGERANRYNIAEDSDISKGTGTSSDHAWYATSNGTNVPYDSAGQHPPGLSGNRLYFKGAPNTSQYVTQNILVSGEADDRYVFTGWISGNALPINGTTRFCGLKLAFMNGNEIVSLDYISAEPHLESQSQWQYLAGEAVATGAYTSIQLIAEHSYNANVVYFDGLQLFKEELGETYTYDDNGNVTKVRNAIGQETTYAYNTQNELTATILPTNIKIENEYENHNIKKATRKYSQTNSNGIVEYDSFETTEYTYDSYGNTLTTKITASGVTKTTSAEYENRGNTLKSTTNAEGYKTLYSYDANTGVLNSVKYPESSYIYYAYNLDTFQLTKSYTTVNGKEMSAEYSYKDDVLEQIRTPSTTYSIDYGDFALRTSISIVDNTLATYYYTDYEDQYLEALDYGNGDKVQYTYDNLGRVVQEVYSEEDKSIFRTVTYTYDANGALATTTDSKTGKTTKNYYDNVGRSTGWRETTGSVIHSLRYSYDEKGRVNQVAEAYRPNSSSTGDRLKATYCYDTVYGRLKSIVFSNGATETYVYDNFERIKKKTAMYNSTNVLTETITYDTNSDHVKTLAVDNYGTYEYKYDAKGNITFVTKGDKTTKYIYDSANQLIRENNQEAGKTWVWTYDSAGNITSKKEYAYTAADDPGSATTSISYGYGNDAWGDLLTSYNGKTITYDAIGNPLNDGTWSYTWSQGRQLSQMSYANNIWNFTYDANGMRTGRSNTGTVYTYVYNGTQLSRMYSSSSGTMTFAYGADGSPLTITYGGATYYYVTNLQGDVVAILDSTGAQVVGYVYDAWGRLISTTGTLKSTLGLHNPLRYRGYVYDTETGLYYLRSRYYNPTIGRFINADIFVSTDQGLLSNNMYTYCLNNPIAYSDHTGESATIAGAICGAFFGALNAVISGGDFEEIVQCTLVGMATGAAAGFVADLCIATCGVGTAILYSAVAGGIMSATNSAASQYVLNDGQIDPAKVAYDGIIGAAAGGASTAMGDLVKPVAKGLGDGINHVNTLISTEIIMTTSGTITTSYLFDIGCSAVTGFGAWLFGSACDYYNSMG